MLHIALLTQDKGNKCSYYSADVFPLYMQRGLLLEVEAEDPHLPIIDNMR
jgi:hypothetical protein